MINRCINKYLAYKYKTVAHFVEHPIKVQQQIFRYLVQNGAKTFYGQKYNFHQIDSQNRYRETVPVITYEQLRPYLDIIIHERKANILWNKPVKWFAMSSGTTEDRSKYIPVTTDSLYNGHYYCGKQMLSIYARHNPYSTFMLGKTLIIGGSKQYNTIGDEIYTADISAILLKNALWWTKYSKTPESIALMSDWDQKLEALTKYALKSDVRALMGVPSWLLILLQRIQEYAQIPLTSLWPKLEVFFHGGVRFDPYHPQYKSLIPNPNMQYWETYNASEGFFGVQYTPESKDLLLMLDCGVYYEFIPANQWQEANPETLTLEEVEPHKNYALVISTNGGLWRYMIGDTIMFTSTNPYLFRITGRVKSFINAFGEELIVDNTDRALIYACQETNTKILEYTVAPIYPDIHQQTKAGHQWLIECEQLPSTNLLHFAKLLDEKLQQQNSDYAAKRYNNITLQMPQITIVPKGTFQQWMRTAGKLGGQHKVPRLSNDRVIVDDILKTANMINKD